MKKINILVILLTLFTASCYYDNAEELYPDDPCDTSNVTYSLSVVPIIDRECIVCHSASANLGNVTLEGYAEIKKYVDNGKLRSSITHDGNASPMPKDGNKMSDCNIKIIQTWLDANAPNN